MNISKFNKCVITFSIIIVGFLGIISLVNFTDLLPYSIIIEESDLSNSDLTKYQFLVMLLRIFIYFIMPTAAFLLVKLIFKKYTQWKIIDFFDYSFKLISIISSVYIFLAFDIRYGFAIFDKSEVYLSIIGIIFVRSLKKSNLV